MNLTPQSMRSPMSPFNEESKSSFASRYPTTPQPEPTNMEQPSRGLGIFDCSMPQSQSVVHNMPPSPQQSDSWSHSGMLEHDYPQATQAPDIFSAAFDPFSGYNHNANNAIMSTSSPEAPGLVFCQTPPSTNMPSHRSSISSSYSPPQQNAEYYTPKVKQEDRNEWYPSPGNEQILQRSLNTQEFTPYSNDVSPIHGSTEDLYKSNGSDWSKQSSGYPMEFDTMLGEESRTRYDGGPVLPSVNRIKKKRQRTTPEEATHECQVCGKLFKRSYNWKSHMETHNPERKYPHPCTAMVGNQPCTKKFQRKTDLDRHYDSVHLKARNHRCNLCGNRFARRDTLRRHTEDGCPKRFELGFREGSASTPARWSLTNFPTRNRAYSIGGISQPISSMGPPMHSLSSGPSQQAFTGYNRSEFVSSPVQTAAGFAP